MSELYVRAYDRFVTKRVTFSLGFQLCSNPFEGRHYHIGSSCIILANVWIHNYDPRLVASPCAATIKQSFSDNHINILVNEPSMSSHLMYKRLLRAILVP